MQLLIRLSYIYLVYYINLDVISMQNNRNLTFRFLFKNELSIIHYHKFLFRNQILHVMDVDFPTVGQTIGITT